jgi:hypothetical protein
VALAMGVALMFALGATSSAAAKAPVRASHSQAKVQTVVAHAAGHKIA